TSASSDTVADEAFQQDWELFTQQDVVEDKKPAYYLYRLSPPPTSTFLFLTYVPDSSPVRQKMLYASTSSALRKTLGGDSRLPQSIFATSPQDLTYESYLAHTKHAQAEAPLTAREMDMEEVRRVEKLQTDVEGDGGEESRKGRSIIFGTGAAGGENSESQVRGVLLWSEDAKEAVAALGKAEEEEGARSIAVLEIDIAKETVVLAPEQPTELVLPPSSPCYFFYRHAAGPVLVYSCPPASPIKSRLVYSSAALVLYKVAVPQFAGIKVLKKLETDDPSEVTLAWIDSELGPLATLASTASSAVSANDSLASGSGTSTPALLPEEEKPKFARPQRPGRRR
ncbi:hypothetical protein JCM11641_001477, partial [Rhodosporidiobolus odoratus]